MRCNVRMADEAYHIGPSQAAKSYLHIPTLLDVAQRAGAQAVHPGYGFLSENATFVEVCPGSGSDICWPFSRGATGDG